MALGRLRRRRRGPRSDRATATGADDVPAPPVFVGGTGRSGTTVAARLVATSSRYALVPVEIHLHAAAGGLADLLEGHVDLERFRREVLGSWYYRTPRRGRMRGLHAIAAGHAVEAALDRFRRRFEADPEAAAAELLHELLDPVASRAGKPGWVEMSPPSARVAGVLHRALPRARFVHMARDGRDVASSVIRRPWGPDDYPSAIAWWEREMAAVLAAQADLPEDRMLTLWLEDLVLHRREESYGRLRAFLGLDDEPAMRAFFDSDMAPERARRGRWRRDLDERAARDLDAAYQRALSRLEASGLRRG